MGKIAAVAPQIPGVCASFFVGTPHNDAQLGLARQWAEARGGRRRAEPDRQPAEQVTRSQRQARLSWVKVE